MVIGAVTKGSQRFKQTYEMVKRLECFWRFRVRKGVRTFRKRFRSLPKYLWPFRVRKGVGNSEAVPKWHFQNETSEAPEPLWFTVEYCQWVIHQYVVITWQGRASELAKRGDSVWHCHVQQGPIPRKLGSYTRSDFSTCICMSSHIV